MSDHEQKLPNRAALREMALSRWENEGGATAFDLDARLFSEETPSDVPSEETPSDVPPLSNAELVQLRIRVIAMENLMIAVLAGASKRQLELAREMAAYISPRPGRTHHPLTIHAAAQMIRLVERAGQF